jgi:hypothetical protein
MTNLTCNLRCTIIAALATGVVSAGSAAAHEAWLLTPSEVAALSRMTPPALFTNPWLLGLAAAIGGTLAAVALRLEDRFRGIEAQIAAPLRALATVGGPLALRAGLAATLALGALGGLPRHGTAPWSQPTLMVPDMQLALAPGWDWLALVEVALAVLLAFGAMTRLAGLGVVALACAGLAAFGVSFLDYAPHFIAPGLMLAICGGGALSVDRSLGIEAWLQPGARLTRVGWAACLALIGGGFVYLAIAVKLTQPTLIMAILEHGDVPRLGLSLPVTALVMTGVELIAGALLAMGRLVRPIAMVLMGGFGFFAVTLGETPLLHANLIGAMVMLVMAGRMAPRGLLAARSALLAA